MRRRRRRHINSYSRGNLASGVNASQIQEAGILLHGLNARNTSTKQQSVQCAYGTNLADELDGAGLSLSLDNLLVLLLASFLDGQSGALSVLLCNLLGLDRGRKLGSKREISDGNIVKDEPELLGALTELITVSRQQCC